MNTNYKALIDNPSIEVLPFQFAKVKASLEKTPQGTEVYLPFIPGSNIFDAIEPCKQLIAMGKTPVPHITARTQQSLADVEKILKEFTDIGVDTALFLAGDISKPKGELSSTLDFISGGIIEKSGIKNVRFAGHPTGHPSVQDEVLLDAVIAKQQWSEKTGIPVSLITQFVFSSKEAIEWETMLRGNGIKLPIKLGITGPAKISTLIKYAIQCGVVTSAKMLAKNFDITKLLTTWTADNLVKEVYEHKYQSESLISAFHIYPFGGIKNSVLWYASLIEANSE